MTTKQAYIKLKSTDWHEKVKERVALETE